MKKIALTALLLLGCTNEGATKDILTSQGYTNIEVTGHESFACSDDDSTCTGFVATSPSGHRVEGVVGCGIIGKACTVRFTH